MPPPMHPGRADCLTPTQAARLLGVSNFTVQRWLDAGRLRGTHTPLGRLIEAQSVRELVDQQLAAAEAVVAQMREVAQRQPATIAGPLDGASELRWNG